MMSIPSFTAATGGECLLTQTGEFDPVKGFQVKLTTTIGGGLGLSYQIFEHEKVNVDALTSVLILWVPKSTSNLGVIAAICGKMGAKMWVAPQLTASDFGGTADAIPVCTVQDGSVANAAQCQCGSTAKCTTATGLICTGTGTGVCSAPPTSAASELPTECPCPGVTPGANAPHSIAIVKDRLTLSWRLCPTCPAESKTKPFVSFLITIHQPADTPPITWFGLGVRPSGKTSMAMKESDMVIGLVSENKVQDFWCGEDMFPTRDSTTKRNLLNASLIQTTSTSTPSTAIHARWSRYLETTDLTTDHTLVVDKTMNWMWTMDDTGDKTPIKMPSLRGTLEFRLQDHTGGSNGMGINSGDGSEIQNVKLAHGVIMGLGWGFFMPLSALAVRYSKSYRSGWVNEHVALTKIGAAGTISFIIVAVAAGPKNWAGLHTHALVGIVFALFVLSVTVSGTLAKTGLKNEAKQRSKNTFRKDKCVLCVVWVVWVVLCGVVCCVCCVCCVLYKCTH